MREEARLLTSEAASTEDRKVERLLAFFGVEYARTKPDEFVREVEDAANEHAYRILCSAAAFADVRNCLSPSQVHSVFVYSGDHDKSAPQALSESESVPIFFSLAPKLIDIEAELTTPNFEVRKHELSAVPIVKYVRWAFPRTAWHAPEANACLIIDDPLLRPRYGFIRFDKLLGLMERHNFTASVAFIPWNWRRNNRRTVELFKQNRARYSICIHGCDHTATEFGTNNADALRSKTATAVQRMSAHAQNSGLVHDQVMVFPQGVFSPAAIGTLKEANFLAVVNTEVKSSSPPNRPLRIADVWQTAVMLYDDFPIYTRRYPRQGVENLAFDLLLGKPCFIVIHHEYCSDDCERLVEFIDQLNALPAPSLAQPG